MSKRQTPIGSIRGTRHRRRHADGTTRHRNWAKRSRLRRRSKRVGK